MRSFKTITISLPGPMGKEMEKVAKEEHRTVSDLLREAFRQYQAHRHLSILAREGKKAVRKKGLKAIR